MNPTILIDTREQTPLTFSKLENKMETLTTGDYSLSGFESSFAIERKTISDLIGSLTQGRERFMREIARMTGMKFCRLLIVGTRQEIQAGDYRSQANPRAILASLAAIEAKGVPVVFAATASEAAALIESWAVYFYREQAKPFIPDGELRKLTAMIAL
jgi:DNA excision repair protein ERCC-4